MAGGRGASRRGRWRQLRAEEAADPAPDRAPAFRRVGNIADRGFRRAGARRAAGAGAYSRRRARGACCSRRAAATNIISTMRRWRGRWACPSCRGTISSCSTAGFISRPSRASSRSTSCCGAWRPRCSTRSSSIRAAATACRACFRACARERSRWPTGSGRTSRTIARWRPIFQSSRNITLARSRSCRRRTCCEMRDIDVREQVAENRDDYVIRHAWKREPEPRMGRAPHAGA